MPAGARVGDPITCGDTIVKGSGNVFLNGMPVARIGDATAGHPCGPPTTLKEGNDGAVFANNILISVVGNAIVPHGTCDGPPHDGAVANGSPNVFVGGGAGAGGSSNAADIVLTDDQADFIVETYASSRQGNISAYDHAIIESDDEGAETDTGGTTPTTTSVPMSKKQVYVAAAAHKEKVDIKTPPTATETATVAPALAAPPAGGYNYNDITGVDTFAGSFRLSPNFTLSMLTTNTRVSNYAVKTQTTNGRTYHISELVANLRDLCYNVLEPLRVMYPSIRVNSGFRSSSNGNGRSQHERGQAVDLSLATTDTNSDAAWTVAQAIANSSVPYDQFIFEQNNSIWFHVSYDKSRGNQRRMVMTKPRGVAKPTAGLRRVV